MFLGRSHASLRVLELIDKFARSSSTVLIVGESGVGKDVAAKEIHARSPRRGRFIAINCSAIPRDLIEDELFGHERGAFTNALTRRLGIFEQAQGGTVFLDEITEMSRDLQPKLLRVLEEHSIRRIGGDEHVPIDVRVISATNRSPLEAIEASQFRGDLYHRLNVLGLTIPPLRERLDDLDLLVMHFVAEVNREQGKEADGPDPTCLSALRAHSWPGNVRELRNVIERAVVTVEHGRITIADLPEHIRRLPQASSEFVVRLPSTLESVQRELIKRTLEASGDNRSVAAEMLGVHRRQLYVLLHKNGFARKSRRNS